MLLNFGETVHVQQYESGGQPVTCLVLIRTHGYFRALAILTMQKIIMRRLMPPIKVSPRDPSRCEMLALLANIALSVNSGSS
jgi:hypothetical protein